MNFFNNHQVFYPWQNFLRKNGFDYLFRPREVFWLNKMRSLKISRDQKILEVGCGRGVTLDRISSQFKCKTYGIDIAEEAIRDAKKESLFDHNLSVGSADKIPFTDNYFDVVVSFDVLEHVKNQERVISEIVRVTKKGGKILIYTINRSQTLTWNHLISKFGIDIYKRSDHDFKLFIDAGKLKNNFEKLGVKCRKTIYYDAFFTLAFNELLTLFLMSLKGLEKNFKVGKMILTMTTIVSYIFTPILFILDLPWTLFGESNALTVIGTKQ